MPIANDRQLPDDVPATTPGSSRLPDATVWLVRHGQSESNAGRPSLDPASIPLTALGRRQAAAVANVLPENPAMFIVSEYVRSQQTAAVLQQRFPDTPAVAWPVHEFTYLPHADYFRTTADDRRDRVDEYWQAARPHTRLGPQSESFADFMGRVVDVKRRLLVQKNGPLVIVSHKKFISALIWTVIAGEPKLSARRMRRYRGFDLAVSIKNGALLPLYIDRDHIWVGPTRVDHLSDIQHWA